MVRIAVHINRQRITARTGLANDSLLFRSSQRGRVHITRATWERIGGDFRCERRGEVDVKGKGLVETWHLVGRHGDGAAV